MSRCPATPPLADAPLGPTTSARDGPRPDGRQISREAFEGDVSPFIEYQQIAVSQSVPFEEYVKALGL